MNIRFSSLSACALGVGILLGTVGTASGQAIINLPPHVVIGTRIETSPDELSPSVTIITRAEIEERGYDRIEDVLARIPGITIVNTGQTGNIVSIFTRGTESNHTAVLLNGRRLNRGFSGLYNLADYSLQGINQVEVLRGASSALYGSDAIGGTVNLRTLPALSGSRETTISAEAGSFGTVKSEFNSLYADEKLSYNLGGSIFHTENDTTNGANNDFDFWNIVPYFSYQVNDILTADLQLLYTHAETAAPGDRFNPGYPAAEINETETWMISPGFQVIQDDYQVKGFVSRTENRFWVTNTAFSDRNFRAITDEIQVQLDYLGLENTRLTAGLAYHNEDFLQIDQTGGGFQNYNESWNSKAVFAQAERKFNEVWIVRAGARFEDYSDYADADTYTGEIARIFPNQELTVFAKVSTGYAPPTGVDFSFDGDPTTIPDPEKSISYEVGARKYFAQKRFMMEGSLFYSRISNYIDIADNVSFDTVNFGKIRIQGLELSFIAHLNDALELYGNYTYLDAINKDPYRGSIEAYSRLPRRPRHQLLLGGIHRFEKGHVGAEFQGVYDREDLDFNFPTGKLDIEDYTLVRIFGSYNVTEDISLFGRIENVLDEDYDTTYGYKGHGVGAYAGFRIKL